MYSKWKGAKALGLSVLAVLSLMSVMATAAEAGEFKVNGKTFASAGVKSESIQGSILLSNFAVWGIGLEIHCAGGNVSGKIFQGGTVALAVQLSGCTIVDNKFCTILESEEGGSGKIHTEGEGEVISHGGKHYVKFESEEFNTVYIAGALCSLPEEMVAGGSAAMRIPEISSELTTHQYTSAAYDEELLGVSLQCSSEPASVLGSNGHLALAGSHANEPWSFE